MNEIRISNGSWLTRWLRWLWWKATGRGFWLSIAMLEGTGEDGEPMVSFKPRGFVIRW